MASSDGSILIFARYPSPGHSKTRLIPALGPDGAARLQRRMAELMAAECRRACEESEPGRMKTVVCFTGAQEDEFQSWLGADLAYAAQPGGDLGIRLEQAFRDAFSAGAKRTIAVGTDVPGLSSIILIEAFEQLRECDVVLGPAQDGGYYLIGMRKPLPALFEGIEWGSERVHDQTLAIIDRLGLKTAQLPTLSDVDRPEDLLPLRTDPRFSDLFETVAE